jgi:hypothetical protein
MAEKHPKIAEGVNPYFLEDFFHIRVTGRQVYEHS